MPKNIEKNMLPTPNYQNLNEVDQNARDFDQKVCTLNQNVRYFCTSYYSNVL